MDELLAVFSLPKFTRPPVAEVAISMAFGSSLPLLRLAALASEVEGEFPNQQEAPPVGVVPEAETPFAQALLQLQTSPVVRFVCTSEDGERQLQFQNDLVGRRTGSEGGAPTLSSIPFGSCSIAPTTSSEPKQHRAARRSPAPVALDVTYVNIISDSEKRSRALRPFLRLCRTDGWGPPNGHLWSDVGRARQRTATSSSDGFGGADRRCAP